MVISSIEALHTLAQDLILQWYRHFLLEWTLWVGKTQFTKEVVSLLWWDPHVVQSPTYTYMNTYHLWNNQQLLHMDLYRLETYEDTVNKWIFEAIDHHDIICIERPKREDHYLDNNRVRLEFSFTSDWDREITILHY